MWGGDLAKCLLLLKYQWMRRVWSVVLGYFGHGVGLRGKVSFYIAGRVGSDS